MDSSPDSTPTTASAMESASLSSGKEPAARGRHFFLATGDPSDALYSAVWILVTIAFCGLSAGLGGATNGWELGLYAPLFSHAVQWLVCTLHAFPYQTEVYYDLTGSITYALLAVGTLSITAGRTRSVHARQLVATAFVLVWCTRLGSFLFQRIRRDNKDARFDSLKPYFVAFFGTWNIQGAWCFLTGLAVWAANARDPAEQPAFGWLDGIGVCVWCVGFGIEVVADRQKATWRALPSSKGRYIDVGLWRYSRHPNYFGEWLLWTGQFVLCASAFGGGDATGAFVGAGFLSAASPVFVYLLLNYVSGVPLLEKRSDERWGGEQVYLAYKRETYVFFLLPTRRTEASRPLL